MKIQCQGLTSKFAELLAWVVGLYSGLVLVNKLSCSLLWPVLSLSKRKTISFFFSMVAQYSAAIDHEDQCFS